MRICVFVYVYIVYVSYVYIVCIVYVYAYLHSLVWIGVTIIFTITGILFDLIYILKEKFIRNSLKYNNKTYN